MQCKAASPAPRRAPADPWRFRPSAPAAGSRASTAGTAPRRSTRGKAAADPERAVRRRKTFAGVDVGSRRLHAAVLDAGARVRDAAAFAAEDLPALAAWLEGTTTVAVDAPAELSSLAHAGDAALAPKFRRARCAEVALGRELRVWVPWVAPPERPAPAWMETGLALYAELRSRRLTALEVYPHAGFRLLAGRPLARKSTAAGRVERAAVLRRAGARGAPLATWPHHLLDALLCALVALQHAEGRARRVGCGHDGSAIWLPALS